MQDNFFVFRNNNIALRKECKNYGDQNVKISVGSVKITDNNIINKIEDKKRRVREIFRFYREDCKGHFKAYTTNITLNNQENPPQSSAAPLPKTNVEKKVSNKHLETYRNLIQSLIDEQYLTEDGKCWTKSLSLFVKFAEYVNENLLIKQYKDRKKTLQVYYWKVFADDFSLIANGQIRPIKAQALYKASDKNLSKNYIEGEAELEEIFKELESANTKISNH